MEFKTNHKSFQTRLFDKLPIQNTLAVRQLAAKLVWCDHFSGWGVCPLFRHNNFDLCKPPQVKYRSLNCLGCGVELDIKYYPPTGRGIITRQQAGASQLLAMDKKNAPKVPVFGILKRGGKVYTQVIPDAASRTLMPIIREKVQPDSIVYSDCWRGYNVLDVSEFKHYRINQSKLFVNKHNHLNGIENFWNQAKRHMGKFNGIPAKHFKLFLKECEWRFNNSDPIDQLSRLKQLVKKHIG